MNISFYANMNDLDRIDAVITGKEFDDYSIEVYNTIAKLAPIYCKRMVLVQVSYSDFLKLQDILKFKQHSSEIFKH